ncbi:MAG: 2-phosphosulfolactate phosphatase [Planctomycetota bacterium]|nr:MAG: 2-phosphosulfolactate phosphatase [Planctomycetota bacterium]
MTDGPYLRVNFLPELVAGDALAGAAVAVIDVLRATTTAIAALAAGARDVLPCLTIEDARRRAAEFPVGEAILGGERGGTAIEGFDLGNSPLEYTPHVVAGKSVVLTTTNGTKALLHCQAAAEIVLAGFVNLTAAADRLLKAANKHGGPIDVVCSGTDGAVTREDVLLAGALVDRIAGDDCPAIDDQAALARDAWRTVFGSGEDLPARLLPALVASRGGRNLSALGMQRDIEFAARVDEFQLVPRFDAASHSISPA